MIETTKDLVLVTGGSGFLARHTILALLRGGHRVRASVRSNDRGENVRGVLAAAGANTGRLEFALADLADGPSWRRALNGVSHVLHMATPMDGPDVLAAAIEGTRHVLEASADAGVRRVVLTSSGFAALHPRRPVSPADAVTEEDWTDVTRSGLDAYTRAKTLAERNARTFAQARGLDLVTILPGAILGPALGPERGGWLDLLDSMLSGKMRALPPIDLQMVDVRDLAALHIAALFAPKAAGQRYLAAGESLSLLDIAEILRSDLGEAARQVSTRSMPGWVLRLASLVNPEARRALPLLRPSPRLSSIKAQAELGWTPRPMRQSIGDTARSLGATQ